MTEFTEGIMATDMAVREQPAGGALAMWDQEQVDVLKQLICPGASDVELELFANVCKRTGLDPMARQIYGIMRGQRQQINGEWKTVEKLSIQTSIDGFRLIAERSGKYGGQLGPQWCGPDGEWRDVWLAREYPSAARVGVIRTDWKEPLWATARWDSYVQTYRDRKTSQDVVGAMWQRMPDVMLAKVAESLALRRAFPAELSGLYTAEEMAQAGNQDAPHIEDLPQFQQAAVVESTSAPVRAESDGPPPPYPSGAKPTGSSANGAPTPINKVAASATLTGAPPQQDDARAEAIAGLAKGLAYAKSIKMDPAGIDIEKLTTAEIIETTNDLREQVRQVQAARKKAAAAS